LCEAKQPNPRKNAAVMRVFVFMVYWLKARVYRIDPSLCMSLAHLSRNFEHASDHRSFQRNRLKLRFHYETSSISFCLSDLPLVKWCQCSIEQADDESHRCSRLRRAGGSKVRRCAGSDAKEDEMLIRVFAAGVNHLMAYSGRASTQKFSKCSCLDIRAMTSPALSRKSVRRLVNSKQAILFTPSFQFRWEAATLNTRWRNRVSRVKAGDGQFCRSGARRAQCRFDGMAGAR